MRGLPTHRIVALGAALVPEGPRYLWQSERAREPDARRILCTEMLARSVEQQLARSVRSCSAGWVSASTQNAAARSPGGEQQEMLAIGTGTDMAEPKLLLLDGAEPGLGPEARHTNIRIYC